MSEYRPANVDKDDPNAIRRDIEATRSELGSTIDALQEKLNPEAIKAEVQEVMAVKIEEAKEHVQEAITEKVEEVKEQVQEAITEKVDTVKEQVREATVGRVETMVSNVSEGTRGAGNSIVDTIKANPVPAAMIGLGLGWLLANRQSGGSSSTRVYRGGDTSTSRTYSTGGQYGTGAQYDDRSTVSRTYSTGSTGVRYDESQSVGNRVGNVAQTAGDRVGDVAQNAGDKLGDVAQGAKERVGDITEEASERVSALTDRAQMGAQQAKGTFQQTLDDNPLMVGAVAMALGLAAGLSLPGTEAENRLLGESRDNLVEQAQSVAQDTFQKAAQVAQDVQGEVAETVKETAKESAERQGLVQKA